MNYHDYDYQAWGNTTWLCEELGEYNFEEMAYNDFVAEWLPGSGLTPRQTAKLRAKGLLDLRVEEDTSLSYPKLVRRYPL